MSALDFDGMYARAKKAAKASKPSLPNTTLSVGFLRDIGGVPKTLQFANHCLTEGDANEVLSNIWRLNGWIHAGGRNVMIMGGVPHPNGAILEQLPPWLLKLARQLSPIFNGKTPNQVLINEYVDFQGIAEHCDGPLYHSQAAIVSFESSALVKFRLSDLSVLQSHFSTAHADNKDGVDNVSDLGFEAAVEAKQLSKCCSEQILELLGESNLLPCSSVLEYPENFSVMLPPRSLLVFNDICYEKYVHAIDAVESDIIDDTCVNANLCDVTIGQIVPRCRKRYSLTFRIVKTVAYIIDEFGPCTTELREEINRRKVWWSKAISEDNI